VIKKCCGYTLSDVCPACKKKTKSAHPAKFAQSDKYAKYRRAAKEGKTEA
jgi:rRNA maturation protein Nop10